MRIFHCDFCHQLVFFENVQCVACKHALAFLPDISDLCSIEPAGDTVWKAHAPEAGGRTYRLCSNYAAEQVCNWAIPAGDDHPYCASCRLTRIIPALDVPGNRDAWFQLEAAKRRLVYGLLALNLPVIAKSDDSERGVEFRFLATLAPDGPVLTGHNDGEITINVAEADDAAREKHRVSMHEPYRTLLGHFRHEICHYYWERLIRDSAYIDQFRKLFGDEREDYAAALQRHYDSGPPADWQERYISAYASTHPWEDWAETGAHYFHLTDTLETATECGLAMLPNHHNPRPVRPRFSLRQLDATTFEDMMVDWFAVTYLLNNLNRGLGQKDGYPFVLSAPVVEKLRFIHELCVAAAPPVL